MVKVGKYTSPMEPSWATSFTMERVRTSNFRTFVVLLSTMGFVTITPPFGEDFCHFCPTTVSKQIQVNGW